MTLEPWRAEFLDLLVRSNTQQMTAYLGGPETPRQLLLRNKRYLELAPGGQMFRIVLPEGQVAGSAGYWERTWQGRLIYECGYAVLPEWQGRGVAVAAVGQVARLARAHGRHRHLHAFPAVAHLASNAVCRRAGFTLVEVCDFEYPKGRLTSSHHWRLDLRGH